MILAVDVHYFSSYAVVAGVFFQEWKDAEPFDTMRMIHQGVGGYEPGAFYKRELPPILHFLSKQVRMPDIMVIDGYVHLRQPRKGLGLHLYDQIHCPVIGVAKNPMKIACGYAAVYRGRSKRPLYVSAAGMDLNRACDSVRRMNGPYRIPTLIKKADTLCRGKI